MIAVVALPRQAVVHRGRDSLVLNVMRGEGERAVSTPSCLPWWCRCLSSALSWGLMSCHLS